MLSVDPSTSASVAATDSLSARLCSLSGSSPSQSSTWSLSRAPAHLGTVHFRPVTLKPTEGISKSRTYSASHFSHLSAKQFPLCTVRTFDDYHDHNYYIIPISYGDYDVRL